jgi:probable HAF family extracellular repeat protein
MQSLGSLGGDTAYLSTMKAAGASSDGSVIVGKIPPPSSPFVGQAFRWAATEGMQPLDAQEATGVSGDGSIIVGTRNGKAFRWTSSGGMQDLGSLAPYDYSASSASAISADGTTIVGTTDSPGATNARENFRWTSADGMQGLGQLGIITGISADGSVIVGSIGAFGDPFIWDAVNGRRNLQSIGSAAGWHLHDARGVSADGKTIVGWGHNPEDEIEGWIITIPEPTSLSLLAAAGVATLRRRRRR